ncbi:MAG: hypothetical protein ACYCTF_10495, partial [Acidiferrobacter sp.]
MKNAQGPTQSRPLVAHSIGDLAQQPILPHIRLQTYARHLSSEAGKTNGAQSGIATPPHAHKKSRGRSRTPAPRYLQRPLQHVHPTRAASRLCRLLYDDLAEHA